MKECHYGGFLIITNRTSAIDLYVSWPAAPVFCVSALAALGDLIKWLKRTPGRRKQAHLDCIRAICHRSDALFPIARSESLGSPGVERFFSHTLAAEFYGRERYFTARVAVHTQQQKANEVTPRAYEIFIRRFRITQTEK
jgi:hypothetical protein